MIKELLPHVFNKPIAFHRILAEVAGSVNGGVFLSQAMYWSNIKTAQDGWFYKTSQDWEVETFLSRREQETVRRQLVRIGVLEERRAGIPAKLYFRINGDVLLKMLKDIADTRMSENAKQEATKSTFSHGGKGESITENTSENTTENKNISYDAEFEEFWQAYPKRPGNPKAPAAAKYRYVREKIKIPRETLLSAVKAYAASRDGEESKFTAQAVTWLNQRRWEEDYEPAEVPTASDADLDAIVGKYPGVVSDRNTAKRALAAEMAKGITVEDIVKAAEKFRLYIKQMQQAGTMMAAPILETWIKFKWREMDAYYIYRNPVQRYGILKPVKDKK
jgi:hypothetical protein